MCMSWLLLIIYLFRNLVGLLVQKNNPTVFLYLHKKIRKDLQNSDMRLCHGKFSNTHSQLSRSGRQCTYSTGQLLCSELLRSILVPFSFQREAFKINFFFVCSILHIYHRFCTSKGWKHYSPNATDMRMTARFLRSSVFWRSIQ